jgi:hypothetical protein
MEHGLGVPEGRMWVEWGILCVYGSLAWQAWGARSSRMEIMGVGVPVLAGLGAQACGVNILQGCVGLGGMAQLNWDCAGLYLQHSRPWGHVLAKQRSCRAVQALEAWLAKQRLCRAGGHIPAKWSSCRAVQVLGAWPGRDCAGLCRPGGAWPGRDHKCLWIPGLKGLSHGDSAVLRGGSLG